MYKKRKLCWLLLSVCLFSMTACGGRDKTDNSEAIDAAVQNEETNETDNEEKDEISEEDSLVKEENKISMDDIAWEVDEGIIDGDRFILLNYTNNTPYTLASFEITFKEKPDITEDEKEAFCSELQNELSAKEDEAEKLRSEPISMHTESKIVCNPGETVTNVKCFYYRGIYAVNNINHYTLVEPDIAMIRYVDDADICTVYYDFNSGKYSLESKTDVAYQWSQTNLGNVIPKPDTKIVETSISDDLSFVFDAYGMSLQQFNDYVSECIEMGYTVESNSYEGFYSANNSDGYNIFLDYDEDNCTMTASVRDSEGEVSPVSGMDSKGGHVPPAPGTDSENENMPKESVDSDENGKEDDRNEDLVDGMRPEFKEAMDSYEEFYNEYCDILKRYSKNPSDMQLLTDYANMMTKSAEMTEKFNAWENSDLNNAELEYYLDVNNRVMKKLLEVSE